jgi:hypothetical protein
MRSIAAKEKVMLVSKSVRNNAVIALLAFGVAACGESPMAPSAISPEVAEPLMAKGGKGGGSGNSGSGSESSGRGKDAGSRTFMIWPGTAVLERFGDHVLQMPANAVCDPATSGYGAAFWDKPCARAKEPIQVTAKWSTHNGRALISFSPELRFAPSHDENHWVQLSLRDTKGIDPHRYYTILWFDDVARRWVDESQADPTLKARTTQSGNLVTRRLKHFSEFALWSGFGGYNVTSGVGDTDLGGW